MDFKIIWNKCSSRQDNVLQLRTMLIAYRSRSKTDILIRTGSDQTSPCTAWSFCHIWASTENTFLAFCTIYWQAMNINT